MNIILLKYYCVKVIIFRLNEDEASEIESIGKIKLKKNAQIQLFLFMIYLLIFNP